MGSVSVSGSEGVSVSSGGSVVRLSPEGEGEFVGFVWGERAFVRLVRERGVTEREDVEELVVGERFGSVRARCERGVDRSVRWGGMGDGVERIAGCGGVLFAGWSERAFRGADGERCARTQCSWSEPDVRELGRGGGPLRVVGRRGLWRCRRSGVSRRRRRRR